MIPTPFFTYLETKGVTQRGLLCISQWEQDICKRHWKGLNCSLI